MAKMKYQRVWGLALGVLSGLGFGFVSQTVNLFLLPGIPLHQPPFGATGNILLSVLLGAAIGLTTAWHETAALGVLAGSLLGALAVTIASYFSGSMEVGLRAIKIASLLIIFVPIAAALAPVLMFFRWIIFREDLAVREIRAGYAMPVWPRVLLPVFLMASITSLGLFFKFNNNARDAVLGMNALVQQGIPAASVEDLPEPLRSREVKYFLERAQGSYALEWDKDEGNRYAIPRPASSMNTFSIVIAHYENGYMLVCGFPGIPRATPRCKDFSP